MGCPWCHYSEDKVLDSRSLDQGRAIRRRRQCLRCRRRFTTYEKIERLPLYVIKKNGSRVLFDRPKLQSGIQKACEKRPISLKHIETVVGEIEQALYDRYDYEVSSKVIGEWVMNKLKRLDKVAYVRFASVYREFQDVTEFMKEVKQVLDRKKRRGAN